MERMTEKDVNDVDYNKLVAESDEHIFIYLQKEENTIAVISSDIEKPVRMIAFLMHTNQDFRDRVLEEIRFMEEEDAKLN